MRRLLGINWVVLLIAAAGLSPLAGEQWRIDPNHSAAQFAVRHMMVSTVRGDFGKMTGTVDWDPAASETAKVVAEVDVASVNTRNQKRDDDLRGARFFDVATYPTMKFVSTRIEKAPGGLKMTGDLTIHGVTRPVVFHVDGPAAPVSVRGMLRTGASATTKISRKDFGMVWNRAIETGGVVVGDEVTITVDVELTPMGKGGPGPRRRPSQ